MSVGVILTVRNLSTGIPLKAAPDPDIHSAHVKQAYEWKDARHWIGVAKDDRSNLIINGALQVMI